VTAPVDDPHLAATSSDWSRADPSAPPVFERGVGYPAGQVEALRGALDGLWLCEAGTGFAVRLDAVLARLDRAGLLVTAARRRADTAMALRVYADREHALGAGGGHGPISLPGGWVDGDSFCQCGASEGEDERGNRGCTERLALLRHADEIESGGEVAVDG
jgi:hypothetical protein